MLQLLFAKTKQPLRVLCLGAHSDDIEIGCGGTALRLVRELPDLDVRWIVFGAQDARAEEARKSASYFLRGARTKQVIVQGFRDGFFPHVWSEIKESFEQLKYLQRTGQVDDDLFWTKR